MKEIENKDYEKEIEKLEKEFIDNKNNIHRD